MGPKMLRKDDRRKHCSECGRRYLPEPSARKHQKTCLREKCVRERKARLALRRRARDPEAAREDDRERKRKSRGRLAQEVRSSATPSPAGVLPALVTEAIERAMESLTVGWPEHRSIERELRRVARTALMALRSRPASGEAGMDSPVDPRG